MTLILVNNGNTMNITSPLEKFKETHHFPYTQFKMHKNDKISQWFMVTDQFFVVIYNPKKSKTTTLAFIGPLQIKFPTFFFNGPTIMLFPLLYRMEVLSFSSPFSMLTCFYILSHSYMQVFIS